MEHAGCPQLGRAGRTGGQGRSWKGKRWGWARWGRGSGAGSAGSDRSLLMGGRGRKSNGDRKTTRMAPDSTTTTAPRPQKLVLHGKMTFKRQANEGRASRCGRLLSGEEEGQRTGRTPRGGQHGWGAVSRADSGSGRTRGGGAGQVPQGFGARAGLWGSLSAERHSGPACRAACMAVAGRDVEPGVGSRDSRGTRGGSWRRTRRWRHREVGRVGTRSDV